MTRFSGIIVMLPLATLIICLLELLLCRQGAIFRNVVDGIMSVQWALTICLLVFAGLFTVISFCISDSFLIVLLFISIAYYVNGAATLKDSDSVTLCGGIVLGSGTAAILKTKQQWRVIESGAYLLTLVTLLTLASWWHLDMPGIDYHGPRWMGLWNDPNVYGILMAVGVVLAVGLLAASPKSKVQSPKSEIKSQESVVRSQEAEAGINEEIRSSEFAVRSWPSFFTVHKSAIRSPLSALLLVAVIMMGVGLVMSYSRGAWMGAAVGLIYLARHTKAESGTSLHLVSARQERKAETGEKAEGGTRLLTVSARRERQTKALWYVLPIVLLVAAVIAICWKTPDTAPWYIKRLDLSRGSVQHRVAAWKAGFEMMWDHPFGVGWNKTVAIYQQHYSSPEGGAGAITTNDYLMLGTQLGVPALVCFVAYVGLCLRGRARHSVRAANGSEEGVQGTARPTSSPEASLRVACRAGALVMLVAFWFDGGLFKLATASVFWILLELGAERGKVEVRRQKEEGGGNCEDRRSKMEDSIKPAHQDRYPQSSVRRPCFRSVRTWRSFGAIKPQGI